MDWMTALAILTFVLGLLAASLIWLFVGGILLAVGVKTPTKTDQDALDAAFDAGYEARGRELDA